MGGQGRGLAYGVGAYLLWGLFPLYWPLLKPAGAVEILAHRMVWSLVTTAILVAATGRIRQLRGIFADRRRAGLLTLAAMLVTVNWGIYIWAVNHDRVVETSLGYFATPLLSVLLGVLVLGERLRRLQWIALGMAAVAVVGLTVEYGHLPWVALTLAATFAAYGLTKKAANTGAVESLTFETLVIAPMMLGYLVWLGPRGHAGDGGALLLLLIGSGFITIVPLILFSAAAIRMPLSTLGLVQYLAPIIQFIVGVAIFREAMTSMRWAGFALVWVALVIFTAEALRHRRTQLRLAAEASAI